MSATISKLYAKDILPVGSLTIKVSGLKGLRLRMWAAGLIFRFGALVAGTKLEIDVN